MCFMLNVYVGTLTSRITGHLSVLQVFVRIWEMQLKTRPCQIVTVGCIAVLHANSIQMKFTSHIPLHTKIHYSGVDLARPTFKVTNSTVSESLCIMAISKH